MVHWGSNGNGYSREGFRPEMHAVMQEEMDDLAAGREENVLLIKALANNWSASHLQQVARRRGKNWRFLSALTDQILRAEGMALISLAAMTVAADMSYSMLRKSLFVMERIDRLMLDLERQGKLDERRERMFNRELDAIEHMGSEFRHMFMCSVGRLLNG